MIAVDAVRGGEKAGTVYSLDLKDLKNTAINDQHGFSLFDVVSMARELTGFPLEIEIFGIEPEVIEMQTTLTESVETSVLKLAGIILKNLLY